MNWLSNYILPQWRVAAGVLVLGVVMTLIYDLGWQLGLPLILRNLAGLILFGCIMLGCGVAYVGARVYGASYGQAIKIGLVIPVIWHLKEISLAIGVYGFGPGLYAGLHGPYLFYYGMMFMVMGVAHLLYQIVLRCLAQPGDPMIKSTLLFTLPFMIVGGLEGVVMAVFGFDLFVFQGFLAGYRALFT